MIDVIDSHGKVVFTGEAGEYQLFLLKEKYKRAFSYTIPIWRVLFFSREANYYYWLKRVNKRLCA